uniref:Calcitonin receptor n=1 Tax=Anoplopoma fimbria TaxID=229290 RepID=C3KHV3_ANOFI|nr:Calcitonin receptor precursor [Anoplopoma fimbria]
MVYLHLLIIYLKKMSFPVVLEPMCNRTWDGWLCWDDTKAGVNSEQHCPDYFQDFDPSGKNLCLTVALKVHLH